MGLKPSKGELNEPNLDPVKKVVNDLGRELINLKKEAPPADKKVVDKPAPMPPRIASGYGYRSQKKPQEEATDKIPTKREAWEAKADGVGSRAHELVDELMTAVEGLQDLSRDCEKVHGAK